MDNKFDYDLKALVKSLNIIHLAYVAGLIMLLTIIILMRYQGVLSIEADAELEYMLNTSGALISIFSIPLGYYIFSIRSKQCVAEKDLNKKLELYKSAKIIKYTTFELAGVMNLIVYALTINAENPSKQSLLFFAVVIIIFMINRPSVNNYYENFENQ